MPEYSGTTIPPADGVQVPAMNGASGGNFVLSALRNYILASKGQANGLASLDGNGKLPAAQLPDLADDVIVVASYATLPATGESGKIYITADNNKLYRWDSNASDYVELSVDLSAYATKAEVNALSARITNLEQTTKQDEQTVQYPDDGNYSSIMPDGVPARVADYAEVPTIRGKSRAWNQMVNVPSLSPYSHNGVDFTPNADGSITVNGTATGGDAVFLVIGTTGMVNGHVYLLYDNLPASNNWGFCGNAYFPSRNGFYNVEFNGTILVPNGVNVSNTKVIPLVYDITRIFGAGNEPSTVAEALVQLPALGKYKAYDAGSLVETVVSGVEAIGVNIWNEVASVNSGYFGNECLVNSNLIRVIPSETYYIQCASYNIGSYGLWIALYDVDGNFVSNTAIYSNTLSIPSNVYYFRFGFITAYYGTTYNHDIQICLNSYADKTTYHPYQRNTLMLSSPVTLKSAGAVSEVLDVQTGKKTRPIGSVDLGTLTWQEGVNSGGHRCFYTGGLLSSIKPSASDGDMANITCARYVTLTRNLEYNNEIGIAANVSGYVYIYDPAYESYTYEQFKSAMSGVYLYYELSTPDTDEQVCDPIIDNYIEVEGGGTINTIQSQTPVIDNCLDVTYDFIPA